ncbi:phospho-sugar mutase [Shimazuella kribbensis]|uniref:phospho-sugar mutase n=1 Tax=Shimazuella kribbensis TaxID=139808 RepID=UPI00041042A6|nr:phospho-sugar mutase [Shimazuella kribbensis]
MSCYTHWLHSAALNETERNEVQNCSSEEQQKFNNKLTFGTAGIRGTIGIGPHQLNRFTIRHVTEAFYRYLSTLSKSSLNHSIVIAYDNRHFSRLFAEEAASLLAYHHVDVYLYHDICPTPILSFAIRKLQATGGIMITASHNPPTDNGFKVYGKDGAQLLPIPAKSIEQHMASIPDILTIPTQSFAHAKKSGKIKEVPKEIDEAYFSAVQSLTPCTSTYDSITIVYTPLHGTGQKALPVLLEKEGFIHYHLVKEQSIPHPDFPTVRSPNPEETDAYILAKKLAHNIHADLIVATDPDADRVGIMIPYQHDYLHLTGNQIGVLLLHYLIVEQQRKGTVYSTIVSTSLTKKIADSHQIHTVETLTGFKYIAEQIGQNQDLLLGFEESYGYLIGDFVRDKDGIQTSLYLCHLVAHYKKQGKTLLHVLDNIYQSFGYHENKVVSLPVGTKKNVIDHLFHIFKTVAIKKIDYRTGLHPLPIADVGKVYLQDGSWIAVRPSGTESKIKIYIETVGKDSNQTSQKIAEIKRLVECQF